MPPKGRGVVKNRLNLKAAAGTYTRHALQSRLPRRSTWSWCNTYSNRNGDARLPPASRGDREDYYDPRNSFLNEVLSRRLGIPITLSLVYTEVGKRLGVPLVGVGMPGHFLVRISSGQELVLVTG